MDVILTLYGTSLDEEFETCYSRGKHTKQRNDFSEMAKFPLLRLPPELQDAVISFVGHFTLPLLNLAPFHSTHLRIARLVPYQAIEHDHIATWIAVEFTLLTLFPSLHILRT